MTSLSSAQEAPPRPPFDVWRDTRLSGIGLILVLVVLWELSARTKVIDLVSWPPISVILQSWIALLADGQLLEALVPSLRRLFLGYSVAVSLAVPLGLLIGYSRVAFNLFEPLTELLRPIPASALVPVLILFLGIEDEMKIALIAFASFFPILLNTYGGVRSVDRVLINTGRTFGLNERQIVTKIVLPSALPYILTGMRISLAVSLVLTVIAEMVAGSSGIGYFTQIQQQSFRVPGMYACIFTLGALGYLLNGIFVAISKYLLRWDEGAGRRQA